MCDTLLNFLKPLGICFILIILVFIIQCHNKKDESSNNKSKCESFFNFIKEFCILISILSIASLLLSIFICIISNSLILIPGEKIGESIALIISSIIAVIGVFAGFFFNKKQTYKEIVTKERIEWLHKMQEALAKFLALTSKDTLDENDKKTARKLYYLIISNLNVEKADGKENDRKAVESLYTYARSKELEVELNFDREIKSNKKTDSNCTESHDEKENEIEKSKSNKKTDSNCIGSHDEKENEIEKLKKDKENLENKIKILENKIKILENNKDTDLLAGLRRKEIISEYTIIFNETWNRIKEEAD